MKTPREITYSVLEEVRLKYWAFDHVSERDWRNSHREWALSIEAAIEARDAETELAIKLFRRQIRDLEERLEAAPASLVPEHVIEALRFYADEGIYYTHAEDDCGKRARECLKKLGL